MVGEFPSARPGIPRWLEVCAAAAGLVLLSPVLGLIALLVRFSSPGPALFRQERVGLRGRPFTMLKFRSMRAGQPGTEFTVQGDERITSVGKLLRATKLDELPELWNVVRGEMSLVGPRPEVPRYVDLEDPAWAEVLEVRPGVTDPVTKALRSEERLLAEVPGDREAYYRTVLLPYKLRGYAEYLRRRTFSSDLAVLCTTLLAIVAPSAASASTVPPPATGTPSDSASL